MDWTQDLASLPGGGTQSSSRQWQNSVRTGDIQPEVVPDPQLGEVRSTSWSQVQEEEHLQSASRRGAGTFRCTRYQAQSTFRDLGPV